MRAWRYEDAAGAIAALEFSASNRDITDWWLSSWSNSDAPTRSGIDFTPVAAHREAIAIFAIRREESLTCVAAGSYYERVLGFDLTGQDILILTPAALREERLARAWHIVQGAVTVSQRPYQLSTGGTLMVEEIALPFGDTLADKTRYFLMHNDWRPDAQDLDVVVTTNVWPTQVARIAFF